jgi:hypothetical protein
VSGNGGFTMEDAMQAIINLLIIGMIVIALSLMG